jgi:beta-glucosidase
MTDIPAEDAANASISPETGALIEELLGQMTLAEKCTMLAGRDPWTVPGCPRLGIPNWTVSDGPVGVRSRNMGPGLVVPGPSALAASWNPDLVREIGAALGEECQDKHINILLAPGVNVHRAPRNGQHFEYYSEDPILSAHMAVGSIQGVQSTDVGACVKHFVANDQETNRTTVGVQVDEHTLREIYHPTFEAAVNEASDECSPASNAVRSSGLKARTYIGAFIPSF